MGLRNTKCQNTQRIMPTQNIRRIYELVSEELTFITKKMRDFLYHDHSEDIVIFHIDVIFLQMKTVYIEEQPSYQDFLTPPSYNEDEDEDDTKIRKRKKQIFEKYIKKCISYMSGFCSEYDTIFRDQTK